MIVLLLLSARVCLGLADDSYVEEQYGKTYKWTMPGDTQSLEFTPKDKSEATVLWTRHVGRGTDHKFPPISRKTRKRIIAVQCGLIYCYYDQSYLTQEDSGLYTMRDKDQKLLHTVTIEVIANTESYELNPGESLKFTFDLKPNSCNIYFKPERGLNLKGFESEIVRQGRLQMKGLDEVNCVGFQLSQPCGILIESLQMSCGGRFEVRDQSDNTALVVSLEMKHGVDHTTTKGSGINTTASIIGTVFFLVSFCCGCVRACCGKSSSKGNNSETEGAAPSTPEDEPVGPRSDELSQPSGTHYPAQPSYAPTGPLVHNPPDDMPPSYSEVMAAPFYSDAEPQFELKGITFPSDSASVYTSDKLNIL